MHSNRNKNPSSSSSSGRRPGSLLSSSGASTFFSRTAFRSSSTSTTAGTTAASNARGGLSNYTLPSSSSHKAAPAPAPPTAIAAAASAQDNTDTTGLDDDSGVFLDFGTDITFNEELTRATHKEIEHIDGAIRNTQTGIEQEEKKADIHKKDRVRAYEEMEGFLVAANELKMDAQMTAATRSNLDKTMQMQLVKPLQEAPPMTAATANASKNDKENHGEHDTNTTAAPTSKKFLQEAKQRYVELSQVAETKTMETIQAKAKQVQEEHAKINHAIEKNNLEGVLAQKKEETDNWRSELQAERMRKHQTQSSVNELRESAGRNARAITEKRKLLEEGSAKFEAEKKELEEKLREAQEALSGRKKKEEWEKDIDVAVKQNDALQKMIENAEAMIKKRKEHKKEEETVELSIVTLQKEEQELTAQVTAKETSAEEAEKELTKANQEAEAVTAQKLANDKFEEEKVVPAQTELNEVQKKKEKLTKMISDTNAEMKTETEKAALAEEQQSGELKVLKEQSADLRLKLDTKTKDMEELTRVSEEETKAFEEELRGLESLSESLKEANETEKATLDQAAKAHKKREEECEAALEKAKQGKANVERRKIILDAGVQLKELTQQQLKKIDADWEVEEKAIQEGNYEVNKEKTSHDEKAELEAVVTQTLSQRAVIQQKN